MIRRQVKQTIVFCALMLACIATSTEAPAKGWEPLKAERSDVKAVHHDSEVDIKAARGVLVISTNHTIKIKIFTILGSQIADDTLPPGQYQFMVPAHGVYIVKAGELTCKVAL